MRDARHELQEPAAMRYFRQPRRGDAVYFAT